MNRGIKYLRENKDQVFSDVLKLVESGVTISKACRIVKIISHDLYRVMSQEEKLALTYAKRAQALQAIPGRPDHKGVLKSFVEFLPEDDLV